MSKSYIILAALFIGQALFSANIDIRQQFVNEIGRLSGGINNTNSREEVKNLLAIQNQVDSIKVAFATACEALQYESVHQNSTTKQSAIEEINQIKGFHFQAMDVEQLKSMLIDIYGVIFRYYKGLNN